MWLIDENVRGDDDHSTLCDDEPIGSNIGAVPTQVDAWQDLMEGRFRDDPIPSNIDQCGSEHQVLAGLRDPVRDADDPFTSRLGDAQPLAGEVGRGANAIRIEAVFDLSGGLIDA